MSLKYYLFIEAWLALARWVNVGSDQELLNMESVMRGLEENWLIDRLIDQHHNQHFRWPRCSKSETFILLHTAELKLTCSTITKKSLINHLSPDSCTASWANKLTAGSECSNKPQNQTWCVKFTLLVYHPPDTSAGGGDGLHANMAAKPAVWVSCF